MNPQGIQVSDPDAVVGDRRRSERRQMRGGQKGGIKVIVVDQILVGDAILSSLADLGLEHVGLTVTGAEAMAAVRAHRPALVLIDFSYANAIELGRRIMAEQQDVRIVTMTARRNSEAIAKSARAGFHGYLSKDVPLASLISTIRTVVGGRTVFPIPFGPTEDILPSRADSPGIKFARDLTARELDVLSFIVAGCNSAAIADRLSISPNTVRTHVQNILSKWGVHSRLEAAALAIRHKIVDSAAEMESR